MYLGYTLYVNIRAQMVLDIFEKQISWKKLNAKLSD